MPKKKKQQRNGFYWFMQDILPGLRQEGRVFPNGMQDVVTVALPRWKLLPETERQRYERKAKEEKARQSGLSGDRHRMDNMHNIISERKDPAAELKKRKEREKNIMNARWRDSPDGICDFKFYIMGVEYQCDTEEKDYVPVEIGLVEFSMNAGITKTYHKFIDPGRIKVGARFDCVRHSEDTHQIPVEGFAQADNNYPGIYIQLQNFINPNREKPEYPPIFALHRDLAKVEYALNWIYGESRAGTPNVLEKVFILDVMVTELYRRGTEKFIAESEVSELLLTSAYDYMTDTRCPFHEEQDNKHCALFAARRSEYAICSNLSEVYDFQLTPSHVPKLVDDFSCQVIPPSDVGLKPKYYAPPPRFSQKGGASAMPIAVNNGPFPARDFRYQQQPTQASNQTIVGAGPPEMYHDRDSDNSSDDGITVSLQQTQRLPHTPDDFNKGRGQNTPPNVDDDEEYPSLLGQKFAGRTGPPPAATAPQPPQAWRSAEPSTQRLPRTKPQVLANMESSDVGKLTPPSEIEEKPQQPPPSRVSHPSVQTANPWAAAGLPSAQPVPQSTRGSRPGPTRAWNARGRGARATPSPQPAPQPTPQPVAEPLFSGNASARMEDSVRPSQVDSDIQKPAAYNPWGITVNTSLTKPQPGSYPGGGATNTRPNIASTGNETSPAGGSYTQQPMMQPRGLVTQVGGARFGGRGLSGATRGAFTGRARAPAPQQPAPGLGRGVAGPQTTLNQMYAGAGRGFGRGSPVSRMPPGFEKAVSDMDLHS